MNGESPQRLFQVCVYVCMCSLIEMHNLSGRLWWLEWCVRNWTINGLSESDSWSNRWVLIVWTLWEPYLHRLPSFCISVVLFLSITLFFTGSVTWRWKHSYLARLCPYKCLYYSFYCQCKYESIVMDCLMIGSSDLDVCLCITVKMNHSFPRWYISPGSELLIYHLVLLLNMRNLHYKDKEHKTIYKISKTINMMNYPHKYNTVMMFRNLGTKVVALAKL